MLVLLILELGGGVFSFLATSISGGVKVRIAMACQILHAWISRARRHMTSHQTGSVESICGDHKSLACLSNARLGNATIGRGKLNVSTGGIFHDKTLTLLLFLPP